MKTLLGHCRAGRVMLHCLVAVRSHHWAWAWAGIKRELYAR
jgi:hypothetical protein